MITIDGATGEGGGQVLRTATAMAALLQRPVRIINIRVKRAKPGLRAQHAAGIKALSRMTGGRTEGLAVGSPEVTFWPGKTLKKELEIDIGTAGSVTLLLQGLLPLLAGSRRRVRLTVRGGTDVSWSPPFQYFAQVLVPHLTGMGVGITVDLLSAGFYPKGGGKARISTAPAESLKPLVLTPEPGEVRVKAFAVSSRHLEKARVAERLVTGARSGFPGLRAKKAYYDTASAGCSLLVIASGGGILAGADGLGERGVPAEEIGRRVADDLAGQLARGCTVDRWAVDQLLPFMAMARGRSFVLAPEVTSHARTNMEIISRFLAVSFTVRKEGACFRIACDGVGWPFQDRPS